MVYVKNSIYLQSLNPKRSGPVDASIGCNKDETFTSTATVTGYTESPGILLKFFISNHQSMYRMQAILP